MQFSNCARPVGLGSRLWLRHCINGEHSSFCWWVTAVIIWPCVLDHELSPKLKGAPHRETLIASYCKRSLAASSKWDFIRVWMHLKRQCFQMPCDISVWQIGLHNIFGSMTNKNVHNNKKEKFSLKWWPAFLSQCCFLVKKH